MVISVIESKPNITWWAFFFRRLLFSVDFRILKGMVQGPRDPRQWNLVFRGILFRPSLQYSSFFSFFWSPTNEYIRCLSPPREMALVTLAPAAGDGEMKFFKRNHLLSLGNGSTTCEKDRRLSAKACRSARLKV